MVWLMVYSKTTVYGGNENGTSGHLHVITFFEALNNAFEVQFFRASFLHHITDNDSMQGHGAQIF